MIKIVNNKLKKVNIEGNYIGGNTNYNINSKSFFEDKIFIHYFGEKICKLNGIDIIKNKKNIMDITKIIFLFYNRIYISSSDILQSKILYNEAIFNEMLKFKNSDNSYLISVCGNDNLNEQYYKREKLYFNTGFYSKIDRSNLNPLFEIIETCSVKKIFSTSSNITNEWKSQLINISDNGLNCSISNINIKNLTCLNRQCFKNKTIENLIQIPDKLDEYPFIWESVNLLNLCQKRFDKKSVLNIELFLAQQWVISYLDNYNATIPNILIDNKDISLGISKVTDIQKLISYLNIYGLYRNILLLDFEDIIKLKINYNLLCGVLNYYLNDFKIKNIKNLRNKINRINKSKKTNYKKIMEILSYMEDNRDI